MMRFTSQRQRRAFHQPPGRENARTHQEFATVTAILAQRTDKAILLSREGLITPVWVPKQAIEISSRAPIERAVLKSEVKIGIELNLALQKGLV